MKKLILILVAAISLTGCFETVKNPFTLTQVASVESSYGIVLSAADAYSHLRLCRKSETPTVTNVCAKRAVILQLQKADRDVQTSLDYARNFIRNNPNIDPIVVISSVTKAVDAFKQIAINNKVM